MGAEFFPTRAARSMRRGRAVRFWGHDSAMEVAFFITEDALKRVEPHMRFDEAGLLRAFDSNWDRIWRDGQPRFMRAAAKVRTNLVDLRLLVGAPATRLHPIVNTGRTKPCGFTFSSRKRGRNCGRSRPTSRAAGLPQNHGPWTATGAIGPDKAPPHNFFPRGDRGKQSMPRDFSSGA